MTSMRRLKRRLNRWHRFARKTCWNPRVTHPRWQLRPSVPSGHRRAWDAWVVADENRRCRNVYWPTVESLPVNPRLL